MSPWLATVLVLELKDAEAHAEKSRAFFRVEVGRSSHYAPGDGFNAGTLACGGKFDSEDVHIAIRDYANVGCGTRVLVCSAETEACVTATVEDGGPYGIVTGPNKYAKREGRWKVWTSKEPLPDDWRYRADVDLSDRLWKKLGRPRFLSRVFIVYLAEDE